MKAYVGVTDGDWYRYLAGHGVTEVNFWQPSGGRRFRVLPTGAPFFFKTHFRDPLRNRVVGGGFLSGWASLPLSRAWEIFREANGCASEAEMRKRVEKYRRGKALAGDPEIGCIMLRDVQFFSAEESLPAPSDWSPNLVQGRSYDDVEVSGSPAEKYLTRLLGAHVDALVDAGPGRVGGDVFGDPRLTPTRIGQGAFKALVQEAYGRRCAITGDKVVPVLQAAHIRPVTASGENRVDNGLLLRSDVHTLFDRGYLGIHPQRQELIVSPRLRTDWGNGDEFYRRAASHQQISIPQRAADRPNVEFLKWHADSVFLAH